MSKLNEIWYPWKGIGEPPAGVTGIVLRNGELINDADKLFHFSFWEWQHGPEGYEFGDIVAYTLGETRERVECQSGCRHGCSCYQGRGYVWKMGVLKCQ